MRRLQKTTARVPSIIQSNSNISKRQKRCLATFCPVKLWTLAVFLFVSRLFIIWLCSNFLLLLCVAPAFLIFFYYVSSRETIAIFDILYQSEVLFRARYVRVRKTSLALRGRCAPVILVLSQQRHGRGRRGGGRRWRRGGDVHVEVALWAVYEQHLGGVFAAARVLLFLDEELQTVISKRSAALSWTSDRRRGGDAWGQFNGARDDQVAA